MRKFLALAALVLGLASCQNEPEGLNIVTGGEVDTVVTVAIPEAETRATDPDWNNSAEGVFANGVLEGDATMRYIFQVYYKSVVNGETAIVKSSERQVEYSDGKTVSFPVRLVPNRDYQFVVWADVVNGEADVDNHYNTADLTNITLNETWVAMDETRDAFTATYAANNFNGAQSINIELYRPFAKLRVVTTDYDELAKIGVQATESSIEYRTAINVGFNAYAGDVTGETTTVSHNPAAIKTYANETGDAHTIFADYFFAPKNGTVVSFNLKAFDQNDQLIKENNFTTDIPVKANFLTTLKGDVLTEGNDINVEIKNPFENGSEWNPGNDDYDVEVWDGVTITEPVYDATNKTYTVKNGAELAWIAQEVNNGTKFEGKTVVLAKNINLGGHEWTPIGGAKFFDGTFNGNNKTVGDFKVTTKEGHAGLFGNARGIIKDLTVVNVTIVANHYAGAIVGQGYVKMNNCHANNIDITLSTKNGDWGDKAGGLVGQNCEGATMYITNSTAKNVKIQGYRDLGGIAGMAHNNNTVSGCYVENITILQDLSVNYENPTPTTLGAVIGRKGANVTENDNNTGEGIEIAVIIAEGLTQDIESDDYNVSSAEGLAYIANQVNNEGNTEIANGDIVLNGDIDLASISTFATRSNASNWTPIGTEANPFKGTFDGNGCTIKHLTLVESEAKEGKAYIGFFGYAKDATIKNVTFENVNINIPCLDIDHSQGHIGAVAGSLEGTSTIENVTVKGDIKVEATPSANGASRVAVVAGGNSYGNVTIKNVHVIANDGSYLKANNNTGAIAGQLQGKTVYENCSSNIDVTVNKFFAGGIVGLAGTNDKFIYCHTTGNISVVAGRAGRANDHYRVGGIAGGWADGKNNVCTLEDCSYTGKLKGINADGSVAEVFDYMGYVGRGYTLTNCAGSKVIIDGTEFVQKYDNVYGVYTINGLTPVATADELIAALAADEGVLFMNDITVAVTKGGYNKAGILQNKAETIDGNGKTLTVTGAGATWDCAIYTNGGLIKNLTVAGAMRGIFTAGQSCDLYIENVTFKNVIYTFNSDGTMPANPFGVYVSNSNVNGWTSHSNMHTEVVYTNCSFGEGSGYKFCRPYGKTEFVNCTFCPGYTVDESNTTEITFTDCTWEE
ncbi:MAG: hypothetical protein IKT66_04655 [Alistipes sp.]|nr:hypothetical protein [Alistipes sp.]